MSEKQPGDSYIVAVGGGDDILLSFIGWMPVQGEDAKTALMQVLHEKGFAAYVPFKHEVDGAVRGRLLESLLNGGAVITFEEAGPECLVVVR